MTRLASASPLPEVKSLPRSAPATQGRVVVGIRSDIQGLRAVAVSAVLLFHLWPNRFPGGFAGVDVFFVISGFLITSHLLVRQPRRPRDLLEFWSRRIRRLLPASLLVLAVTLVATRVVAPATQWANTVAQVRAAALYVVNWRLANDSVDYLAADNAPTPVQHFWSLSVEEQFYLGWPLVILAAGLLVAGSVRYRNRVVAAALAVVVAASLLYSMHLTDTDPARAYFVTGTRVWELGLGGLLAAIVRSRLGRRGGLRVPGSARIALAWLGLAAIGLTIFTYSGATPFPGWRALLPTLGATAVIAAASPSGLASPGGVLGLRPVQWLGDVSYSVYLWHWPLIVLVPYAHDGRFGRLERLAVIGISLLLAAVTKRFVEDPFRRPGWGRPLVKPYALAAAAMAAVVAGASLEAADVHHRQQRAKQELARGRVEVAQMLSGRLPLHHSCFGAAAMAAAPGTCRIRSSGHLVPDPIEAPNDKSDAYPQVSGKKDCFAYVPSFPLTTCHFGRRHAAVRVALVGNSHAGQWVSTMESLANAEMWSVTTYLASRCAFADLKQQFDTPAHSAACQSWTRRAERTIAAKHYDLVIMTNRVSVPAEGKGTIRASQAAYGRGYEAVLARLRAAGEPVLALHDTPAPLRSIPDCLAAHPHDYPACNGKARSWIRGEPLTAAVRRLHDPGITYVDLNRYLCRNGTCPAVIGGVVAYFDGSHMTATFARTLAPYLRDYALRAMTAR